MSAPWPAAAVSAVVPPLRRPETAFLGLGSNVGERLDNLQRGVDVVDADARTHVEAVSPVYETEPVGGPEQEPFLNAAARVRTRRTPAGLLRLCHAAERASARVRRQRWGPRTLDVDILLYGSRVVAARRLEIPHPRLAERPFALVPLADVAGGVALPRGGSLSEQLARLRPVEGVARTDAQLQLPGERQR